MKAQDIELLTAGNLDKLNPLGFRNKNLFSFIVERFRAVLVRIPISRKGYCM